MELTREEESALKGEQGETLQMAYRILVATGEATDADKLIPIEWAHLSGVNYNTIGDAGEEFLSSISKNARVKVKTTLNPMGFDVDNVSNYGLDMKILFQNNYQLKIHMRQWGLFLLFHAFHMKFLIFQKMEPKLHLLKVMLQFMQIRMII